MTARDVVSNTFVYDLEQSLIASGYPMQVEVPSDIDEVEITEKDLARAQKLAQLSTTDNGAHGQFLTGIRVSFDLTFTNKAWVEAERYRFLEFVSSQSTMHRITKFDLDNQYIAYVDPRAIDIMKELVADYLAMPSETEEQKELRAIQYLRILYTNPCGFKITARMTTNYRCLRNIYRQRKDHRLPEWRAFCKWVEMLPYAKELLIN